MNNQIIWFDKVSRTFFFYEIPISPIALAFGVAFLCYVISFYLAGYLLHKILADWFPNTFGAKALTNKYMPALVDEEIVSELEGDAYNMSPNIFARFFGMIEKIISWLLTVPKIAHIIVTNKRVIVVEARKFLWFFTWSVVSNSYASNNIVKHGYAMLRSYIFFRSHYLIFGVVGENLYIKSDQGKVKVDEVNQAITKLTS
ncbi:hypothetical protein G6645_00020 [Polynucleobacter paneuropaeus]|nr:hypothetical protein [Polynucleobacter paneuropaeus]MBT8532267.1 hypothetical protein [Polynucleobacter paneuropaeus]MBT8601175.1 hypothetical protein [Polynucleobacter paneuropaeus]MBT8623127.1 hypothetical protein [Polynucleobacter paneuropaeus]MBT8629986.1 hypothetical protein [Polynucleobacter paneuropaeus]